MSCWTYKPSQNFDKALENFGGWCADVIKPSRIRQQASAVMTTLGNTEGAALASVDAYYFPMSGLVLSIKKGPKGRLRICSHPSVDKSSWCIEPEEDDLGPYAEPEHAGPFDTFAEGLRLFFARKPV